MESNSTEPITTTSLPEEIKIITEADNVIKNTTKNEINESSYSVTSDSVLSNVSTYGTFTEDIFESSGFGKGELFVATQDRWVLERKYFIPNSAHPHQNQMPEVCLDVGQLINSMYDFFCSDFYS